MFNDVSLVSNLPLELSLRYLVGLLVLSLLALDPLYLLSRLLCLLLPPDRVNLQLIDNVVSLELKMR